jgi:hypothetical protein
MYYFIYFCFLQNLIQKSSLLFWIYQNNFQHNFVANVLGLFFSVFFSLKMIISSIQDAIGTENVIFVVNLRASDSVLLVLCVINVFLFSFQIIHNEFDVVGNCRTVHNDRASSCSTMEPFSLEQLYISNEFITFIHLYLDFINCGSIRKLLSVLYLSF